MYNEELKNRFMEDSVGRNANIFEIDTVLFNRCAPFEEEYDKDLCMFTTEEISEMYTVFNSPSIEALLSINSQYKIYTYYCMENNIVTSTTNPFEELASKEVINSFVNTALTEAKLVTRKELEKYVDQLVNPSEKFLVLALYEGIAGKELIEISSLTIDNFEDNKVHLCTGRTLTVSDDLVKYAKESANEFTYYPYSESGEMVNRDNIKFLETDEHIMKRLPNGKDDAKQSYVRRRLINKLTRMGECLNTPIFYTKSLKTSGQLEMIKKISDEKGISLEQAARDKDVEYRYGRISSIPRFMLKYEEYLKGL